MARDGISIIVPDKKQCSKCGNIKSSSEFYFRSNNKKLFSQCIVCVRETNRNSYHRHRDKRLARGRVHRSINKDKCLEYGRLYRANNREKRKGAERKYRRNNSDSILNSTLKYKYGISLDDYRSLEKKQEGVCAICGEKEDKGRFSVDHNHTTGSVRGLLCRACNRRLEAIEDFSYLEKALTYLLEYA